MKTKILIVVSIFTVINLFCSKDKKSDVRDYLNSGNTILFDNMKYNLIWSSHPSENYYKQEYLPENDTLEKFSKLILMEVLSDGLGVKEAAGKKVEQLKKLKETDPVVNYDMFEKEGEIMLDFILSKEPDDVNKERMVERNVYRYKLIPNVKGRDGVLLFGMSERAYGNNIEKFLRDLKNNRFNIPNAVGKFNTPEIKITQ